MNTLDILCNDGSPIGVVYEDIYGGADRVGIGGAELALLTMCEQFGRNGYKVRLYNTPRVATSNPYFQQLPVAAFNPQEDRDFLIVFRSPNPKAVGAKGYRIWWSCDPHTVGDYKHFSQTVHKIVVISEFHRAVFLNRYQIQNAEVIDLPIRLEDYEKEIPREPHKVLFSSIPDRGLEYMRLVWPIVLAEFPEARLTITSDYRLWGAPALNEKYRLMFSHIPNVDFIGAVPRDRLVREQLSSQVLAYPCTFEELFCIACAEAEVAGCYPITSGCGALTTTNMEKIVAGDPKDPYWAATFAEEIVDFLKKPDEAIRAEMQKKARERFSPDRIIKIWKEKVFQ